MPKATVLAFILQQEELEKKILLTKRNNHLSQYPDKWCLPGGHIDANESALKAIIREVKEETGLEFKGEFYGYFDEVIPENEIHAVVLLFEGTCNGTLNWDENEVSDARWLSPLDALSLDLAFQHRSVIKQYIEKDFDNSRSAGTLQELSYLRAEVLNRFNNRNQALHFTIILAGILLGLSKVAVDYHVILLFPIIGTTLAALWSHNDQRISQIGRYIKEHIEPKVSGLGWQNHISTIYNKNASKLFKKFQEYTVLGIFFITYGITMFFAIMLAANEGKFVWDLFTYIILGFDLLAFYVTWEFIRRRRKDYHKEHIRLQGLERASSSNLDSEEQLPLDDPLPNIKKKIKKGMKKQK